MKIGILTFHRAHNCGAMLQCVALQTVLERRGHYVRVIDCNEIGDERRFKSIDLRAIKKCIRKVVEFFFSVPYFDRRIRRFNAFRQKYIKCCPVDAETFKTAFDLYVVGSDQVFQPNLTKSKLPYFLLEPVPDDSKKATYAASFGYESLPQEFRKRYKDALSRFAAISVREVSGQRIIREELLLDKEVKVVLDPTLLLDAEDYARWETPLDIPSEYVLIYSIGGADRKLREVARQIAESQHIPVVNVNACRRHYFDIPRSDLIDVSPDRFLYLIRHAKYVVTTSFHGVAFSLIYKRPFIAIAPHDSKVVSRIDGLLNLISLAHNCVKEDAALTNDELLDLLKIDFAPVCSLLSSARRSSLEYLSEITTDDGIERKMGEPRNRSDVCHEGCP